MSKQEPKTTFPPIHIGELIREDIRKQGMLLATFAKGIGIDSSAAVRMLRRPDIDVQRIRQISEFMGIDYFSHYCSPASQEVLAAGNSRHLVEEELRETQAAWKHTQEELEASKAKAIADLEAQAARFNSEISSKEQALSELKQQLEKEIELRREAEVQVRVLEGKLEVLKDVK